MSKRFALQYLLNHRWALDSDVLSLMADIARRGDMSLDVGELKATFGEVARQAVSARSGQALSRRLEVRDGVGVLHVNGVISRYAALFEDACGGASVETLAKEYNAALDNPEIKALVVVFDTPGGDPSGVHEFAAMVAANRGRKPQVAYVGDRCASAGYWMAAAFDEVVINPAASAGSIGVVAGLKKHTPPEGEEYFELVSSQSPKKRLDPTTGEGRALLQAEVDQLAALFVDQVAEHRGVARETVLSDFGQGAMLMGEKAVSAGMADRLGTFEELITELRGAVDSMSKKTSINEAPVQVAGAVTALKALDGAVILGALDELPELKAHLVAGLVEVEATALESAPEVLAACNEAGFPALAATVLVDGVSKAAALQQVQQATALKGALAAAGMPDVMPELLAHLDDPAKLVGLVLHEKTALDDDERDIEGQLAPGSKEARQKTALAASLDANSIYERRKA